VEKPKEPATPPAQPDDEKATARAFAALARERKKIKAAEEALAADKAKLEQDRADLARYRELQALAKSKPLEVVGAFGLDYDGITKAQLEQPDPAVAKVQERVDALERERIAREDADKASTVAAKATEERTLADWHRGVLEEVTKAGDAYELTNRLGQAGEVAELIKLTWAREHRMMPVDEAAKLVETSLEAKVLGTTKVKSKFAPLPAAPAPAAVAPAKHSPTLSTAAAASGSQTVDNSEKARVARARARVSELLTPRR
jgi:hypothetical protein